MKVISDDDVLKRKASELLDAHAATLEKAKENQKLDSIKAERKYAPSLSPSLFLFRQHCCCVQLLLM